MEEEATTAGELGWERETRIGTTLHGGALAGGGNTWKAPSVASDEAGARSRHGARPAQRGKPGDRQDKSSAKPWECWATTGAARPPEWPMSPPGGGDKEGLREASGVAEKSRGSRHRVGRGVKLPQGTDTSGVKELPRGTKFPV